MSKVLFQVIFYLKSNLTCLTIFKFMMYISGKFARQSSILTDLLRSIPNWPIKIPNVRSKLLAIWHISRVFSDRWPRGISPLIYIDFLLPEMSTSHDAINYKEHPCTLEWNRHFLLWTPTAHVSNIRIYWHGVSSVRSETDKNAGDCTHRENWSAYCHLHVYAGSVNQQQTD